MVESTKVGGDQMTKTALSPKHARNRIVSELIDIHESTELDIKHFDYVLENLKEYTGINSHETKKQRDAYKEKNAHIEKKIEIAQEIWGDLEYVPYYMRWRNYAPEEMHELNNASWF